MMNHNIEPNQFPDYVIDLCSLVMNPKQDFPLHYDDSGHAKALVDVAVERIIALEAALKIAIEQFNELGELQATGNYNTGESGGEVMCLGKPLQLDKGEVETNQWLEEIYNSMWCNPIIAKLLQAAEDKYNSGN